MDNIIPLLFGAIALIVIARRFMQSWGWVKNLVFFFGAATLFSSCAATKGLKGLFKPEPAVIVFRDTIRMVKHDTTVTVKTKTDTTILIRPVTTYIDTVQCPPSSKDTIIYKTRTVRGEDRLITVTDSIFFRDTIRITEQIPVGNTEDNSLWKVISGLVASLIAFIAWLRRKEKEDPPAPPTGQLQYV